LPDEAKYVVAILPLTRTQMVEMVTWLAQYRKTHVQV